MKRTNGTNKHGLWFAGMYNTNILLWADIKVIEEFVNSMSNTDTANCGGYRQNTGISVFFPFYCLQNTNINT